jgi:hypothetical protein
VLPLILALSMGANAGPVSVVVSSKRAGADQYAGKLATRVHQALTREGFSDALDDAATAKLVKGAGFSDARNCQGGQKCLQKLAVLVGPKAVIVGVDVGKVGKELAVHLEAISAVDASTLAVSDFTTGIDNYGDESAVPITLFVRALQSKIATPVAQDTPKVEEKPKPEEKPVVADVPPPPPPPMVTEEPKPKSHLPAWLCTGGAVVGAGVAATFGIIGLGDKGTYDKSITKTSAGILTSTLSRSDLDALGNRINSDFTIALISGAVAAAFLAAALYFWMAN